MKINEYIIYILNDIILSEKRIKQALFFNTMLFVASKLRNIFLKK